MLRKTLLEGPKTILRPLYDSNVAEVSIIKCSPNLNWVYRSSVFGIPKNGKITHFACIFEIFGYAKNTTSVSTNQVAVFGIVSFDIIGDREMLCKIYYETS